MKKEYSKELKKGMKAGDKVKVTKEETGHEFKIGCIVTLISTEDNKFFNKKYGSWWLNKNEYVLVKKNNPKKKTSTKRKELAVEDNFECAGPVVVATAEDVYVAGVEKGGFESFSYQKRAEEEVKDNDKTYLIIIIVLLVITIAYRMFV